MAASRLRRSERWKARQTGGLWECHKGQSPGVRILGSENQTLTSYGARLVGRAERRLPTKRAPRHTEIEAGLRQTRG